LSAALRKLSCILQICNAGSLNWIKQSIIVNSKGSERNKMSYSQFKEFIKSIGLPRTEADEGELALTKVEALKALRLLSDTNVAVLGGDVYKLESDGYFRPTYDNWCCNKEDMSASEFAKLSHEKSLQYLENYNEGGDSNIRYVLVIDA
jgi:hypothetical protein